MSFSFFFPLSLFSLFFLVSFCRLLRNRYSLFLFCSFAQFSSPSSSTYYSVIHSFIHLFVYHLVSFCSSFNASILVKNRRQIDKFNMKCRWQSIAECHLLRLPLVMFLLHIVYTIALASSLVLAILVLILVWLFHLSGMSYG